MKRFKVIPAFIFVDKFVEDSDESRILEAIKDAASNFGESVVVFDEDTNDRESDVVVFGRGEFENLPHID